MTIKDLQNLTLFMTLELRNRSSKICLVNPPPTHFQELTVFKHQMIKSALTVQSVSEYGFNINISLKCKHETWPWDSDMSN